MENLDIYSSIAKRSGGDIYIGVVGPVRTGKSTFIANFMQTLVIPAIENKHERQRAIDDIPQSADGKTIMTTQPKFVPSKGCKVKINDQTTANVRLVDCVGYVVKGADGTKLEDGKDRMVKTPWSDEEMTFDKAAEIGTQKVIKEHSNVGILLTCDGTIKSELSRDSYIEAEERCAKELSELNKPFVVVLNSSKPSSEETQVLAKSLESKYNTPVVVVDATKLTNQNIEEIFEGLLGQFPLSHIDIKLPEFLQGLPFENPFVQEVVESAKTLNNTIKKIGQYKDMHILDESENFEKATVSQVKMDDGVLVFDVQPKNELFYKVVSNELGFDVQSQGELIGSLSKLAAAKRSYDKVKDALESANNFGYGIVNPTENELELSEPQLTKQGTKFGVKLKAVAPSLHIMRVDIETEVNPILGTQQQSEQMLNEMMERFEQNKDELWNTNIFGKSLNTLVKEGLNSKLNAMPQNAQSKIRKTTQRIINEGKGGVICILL